MSREIKFRAWCEEDKVMIYDLNSPRLINGKLYDSDNLYEFMQYTGLKDKNGEEIYEGDIAKIKRFTDDEFYNFEVKFLKSSFSMFRINKIIEGENFTLQELDYYLHNFNNECEVMGNIYENIEL